jgi:hypothetical protein
MRAGHPIAKRAWSGQKTRRYLYVFVKPLRVFVTLNEPSRRATTLKKYALPL